MSANKAPPSMREESSYEEWKKEIEIWKLFTDLPKKKHGPALLLSLSGKARDAALELNAVDIAAEDGIDKVIEKLDTLFLVDKDQLAFEAYEQFEGVLAYRLLKSAMLSESEEKLARATTASFTYKDMQECLKKIVGQSKVAPSSSVVSVKQECRGIACPCRHLSW